MTSTQVVETSVTNNSSFQNYPHPAPTRTITLYEPDTPGLKPFTKIVAASLRFGSFCHEDLDKVV